MTSATASRASPRPRPRRSTAHLREVRPRRDRPGVVERDRLLRRLLAAGPARVVVLAAPAGYGKTTLLETWARIDPRPFRWLGPAQGAGWEADALPAQVGAQTDCGEPVVLVLDGDGVAIDPGVVDAVLRLAGRLPERSLVVLATRAAALLPLGRLRLQHEVLELGPEDLAMTRGEAGGALRAAGVELGADAEDALLDRLEGWPAAIALAALSLPGAGGDDAAAAFGGEDRIVAEYVRDEVLGDLPEGLGAFLRHTSVLDALEPELCDAALGGQGAGAALEDLERHGAPVSRHGRREPLRLHPLVREALAAELGRREPAVATRVHRRAAAWLEERGRTEEAAEHALAAGEVDRAAALLWHLTPSYMLDGRAGRLERWLARLPVRRVEQHAALAGVAAARELARARGGHAERWAGLARGRLSAVAPSTRGSVRGGVELLSALTEPTDLPTLRRRGATAAIVLPDDDPWRCVGCLTQGAGAALTGDAEHAEAWLEAGVRIGIVQSAGFAALCEAELALIALHAGDWAHGACLAERARTRVERLRPDDNAMLAPVVAVSAFARAHRGRFEEARDDVLLARRLLDRVEGLPPWYLVQVHVALARAELRLSDLPAGRASLAEASRLATRLPEARALHRWIDDARACAEAPVRTGLSEAEALTPAELRVLRHLPSHLSFREIGARLYVSANTVKTQAHAVYRKLGASSRSSAVERGALLGLIDRESPEP